MLRTAQISFHADPAQRRPVELLQAWPTVVDVAEAAISAGIVVSVIQSSSHRETLRQNGVIYHFLPFGSGVTSSDGYAGFQDLLVGLRPDVLHVQGLGFSADVLALAKAVPGIPILLQDRANRPPRRIWRWPLWRRGLAVARGVAFCSREQAKPFIRTGLLSSRTSIFEIPGSTSRFTPGDQVEARRVTQIDGAPCLLWVGHLNGNKDPLTVLDGISMAARQLPGLKLWCCFGAAPLLSKVRGRIDRDPQLAGRVHLLGKVPHGKIEQLMRAADLLIQSSWHESTGYSVIEALACGLPPVVTDIPSFRVLTGAGAAGHLWTCGDARQLSQAVLHLALQPKGLLRTAARAQFDKELSFEALGRRLRTAYMDLRQSRVAAQMQ